MQTWTDDFAGWVKQPFREDMSVLGWFAFLGLLLALLWAWGLFISRLR